MTDKAKKFHVRVFDNFHYGDESEAYDLGEFENYDEAKTKAQSIVIEFLIHNWRLGTTPDDLIVQFLFYGEDPVILPDDPGQEKSFSAREFANSMAAEICDNCEMKLSDAERIRHNELKSENANKKAIMQENMAANIREEKKTATRSSWKNFPIAVERRITTSLIFTAEEFNKIKKGFIPGGQDDKWFIFYENGWLYFHRSWTGHGMYKAQINNTKDGYVINEFFVQSDKDVYQVGPDKNEINSFTNLIHLFLLED